MKNIDQLSNTQLELLKMFSFELSEKDLNEIRSLLAKYFARKLDSELGTFEDENEISADVFEQWTQEHLRARGE
ncbi:MAG: hypothetical protein ACLFQX_08360 [Candidatus Kapaibacterium sp.]